MAPSDTFRPLVEHSRTVRVPAVSPSPMGMSWEARFSSEEITVPGSVCALILAGGSGSRLKASSSREFRTTPKPLVPISVDGRGPTPMIDVALQELINAGFSRTAVVTSSGRQVGGGQIEAHIASTFGASPGLRLFREPRQSGTGGAAFAALRWLATEYALILMADTLLPYDAVADAVSAHVASHADLTWCVTSRAARQAQNATRLVINPETRAFVWAHEDRPYPSRVAVGRHALAVTSAGAVVLTRQSFIEAFEAHIANSEARSVDLHRVFIPWLDDQPNSTVLAYDLKGPVHDLGTPERLLRHGRRPVFPSSPGNTVPNQHSPQQEMP